MGHPDRTVPFNFRAPNAKKLEVSAQFIRSNPELKTDTNGLWSITLGPIEPDLYPYNFIADGEAVADPNNLHLFPNERFKSSLVDVPGAKPPSMLRKMFRTVKWRMAITTPRHSAASRP